MKPMLSGKLTDVSKLRFPVLASPKLDGIRALVIDGVVVSRNLKPIPNEYVQRRFGRPEYNGLDGELVCGPPTHEACMRLTDSAVMSRSHPQETDISFYVFDDFTAPTDKFEDRLIRAYAKCRYADVQPVHHLKLTSVQMLEEYERDVLADGYEGVMLRSPGGPYKFGRSTEREGWLLKVKQFEDAEAVVIGFDELMHNENAAERDALGRTKRTSHKAGKRSSGVLGALKVRGVNGRYKGVDFDIGSGFDAAQREQIWKGRDVYLGKRVTFRYFPTGSKDKPRFPVFVCFRSDV